MHILLKCIEENQDVGCLEVFLDEAFQKNQKECIITSLYVHTQYRGRGIATSLLFELKKMVMNRLNVFHNIRTFTLTDSSDRFRKDDNLYKKIGFVYDEEGLPEMTWHFRKKSNQSESRMCDDYIIITKIL